MQKKKNYSKSKLNGQIDSCLSKHLDTIMTCSIAQKKVAEYFVHKKCKYGLACKFKGAPPFKKISLLSSLRTEQTGRGALRRTIEYKTEVIKGSYPTNQYSI